MNILQGSFHIQYFGVKTGLFHDINSSAHMCNSTLGSKLRSPLEKPGSRWVVRAKAGARIHIIVTLTEDTKSQNSMEYIKEFPVWGTAANVF